jgi:hypothetical protein
VAPAAALPTIDVPTLAALAAITYALANFLHEAVGHGGACLLMGGQAEVLSTVMAASLGATAALPSFIPEPVGAAKPHTPEVPLGVPRSWGWIVAAAVVSIVVVAFLGPGIRFSP